MLTLHLVEKKSFDTYTQSLDLGSAELFEGKADDREDAVRMARDAAVLARRKDVVAVVPSVHGNPELPSFTTEWLELADVAVVVSAHGNRTIKER